MNARALLTALVAASACVGGGGSPAPVDYTCVIHVWPTCDNNLCHDTPGDEYVDHACATDYRDAADQLKIDQTPGQVACDEGQACTIDCDPTEPATACLE